MNNNKNTQSMTTAELLDEATQLEFALDLDVLRADFRYNAIRAELKSRG